MFLSELENFINRHIVDRDFSICDADIKTYYENLSLEIKGKSFLVIGGAGTIGSSYVRSIVPFGPARITIVDYNENGLTEVIRDLRSTPGLDVPKDIITYAFDFGSLLLAKLFEKDKFDTIACFAAHKHVRSEKDVLAIEAMVTNNLFNTKQLLDYALKNKPDHFFAVSTDKAANPVNVMGCTKKFMENLLLAYSSKLNITTARFANVAFSNGSLLDGFNKRFANGQPFTAPKDIKRYFVTPTESGHICMLASLLGQPSDIFFPKLNDAGMKTFAEIADAYLFELGYKPDHSNSEEEAKIMSANWKPTDTTYPVYYFNSDTSGEKSYEEFFTHDEELDLSAFKSLGIIKNAEKPSIDVINKQLEDLQKLFKASNLSKESIVSFLKDCIPGFEHIETGKNLDSKM
ncbi:MAG TPA: polysaccharide biosynthesis protein [Saprospiraceae bacterium]|nr:polysaccharide biosynthesis protein [Saprospiraceae bacterium]